MSSSDALIVETFESGVTLLKISRPEVMNALNTEVLQELKTKLIALTSDSQTRVLVVTGDGAAFVAGADIQQMKKMTVDEGIQFAKLGHTVTKLLELMPKPTIAAVNGYALGGGAELAMSCDFILASDKAVFALPEVGLGVIPGFGGTLRLSRFVGLPMAKDLIFSGRKIKAEEALRIGLVNRVLPSDHFIKSAVEVAQEIAKHSQGAVSKAKHLLNEFSESMGLNFKLDAEAQVFGGLFESADQVEGMAAFVEKRTPKFQGL